jgi:PPOX class probable F420-dependent enzyme
MTDDEIATFLDEGRTLQVASINKDGTPHLVPMFYGMLDGKLAFWTYGKSQKVVNLRRDPRIACVVETGLQYNELRGVQVNGTARILDDDELKLRFGELLFARYWGEVNDAARAGITAQAAKRVVIVVDPDTVVSWDHNKLGGGY